MNYKHTLGVTSRFSPGDEASLFFEVIHLSEDHELTLRETGTIHGSPWRGKSIPDPAAAVTVVNIVVDLQQVADLTLVEEQAKLQTNVQELTGDWEGYSRRNLISSVPKPIGIAPTQALGLALFQEENLEGFRYVSARMPDRMNLIVFPRKLLKGSRLSYSDASGQSHEIAGKRRIKK